MVYPLNKLNGGYWDRPQTNAWSTGRSEFAPWHHMAPEHRQEQPLSKESGVVPELGIIKCNPKYIFLKMQKICTICIHVLVT